MSRRRLAKAKGRSYEQLSVPADSINQDLLYLCSSSSSSSIVEITMMTLLDIVRQLMELLLLLAIIMFRMTL